MKWDCPRKHLLTLGLEDPGGVTWSSQEHSRLVTNVKAKQRGPAAKMEFLEPEDPVTRIFSRYSSGTRVCLIAKGVGRSGKL